MSSFRRVEAARSEQLAFCDSRRARRPPYGSVYLRQDDEPSYPSNTLSVSTLVFMAQFRNTTPGSLTNGYIFTMFYTKGLLLVFPKAVLVLWAVVFIYAWMRRDRGLRLMGCGCKQTASSRLFPCSWWSTPLPPALWLGNDFWQSHVGLDYDDLETADINRAGCRSGRQR